MWNHRIVKKNGYFGIHEAYYSDLGEVKAITENSVEPFGETLEEIKKDLQHMSEACNKEVLEYDKLFPSKRKPVSPRPKNKPRRNK